MNLNLRPKNKNDIRIFNKIVAEIIKKREIENS